MDRLCICDSWKCVISVYSRLPIDRLFIDMKFVLLHEAKNEEGIRAFFTEVWELYVKVCSLVSCVLVTLHETAV
jgi:hypothetical protein